MSSDIYEMHANIFRALAHPKRIKIIELLEKQGKTCVCEIAAQIQTDQPSVSKHLSILKNAGIIESEKRGLRVECWLKTPAVLDLLKGAQKILKKDLESRYIASLKR